MDAKQFFDKVVFMRKCQKEYFRTRATSALRQSKAVEKEIDNEIERVLNIINQPKKVIQADLFGNPNNR